MTHRLALGALLIALGITAWWTTSQAQDEESCKAACDQQQEECLETCGEHPNPVECSSQCRDDGWSCRNHCP
jgi:hypothetical protein